MHSIPLAVTWTFPRWQFILHVRSVFRSFSTFCIPRVSRILHSTCKRSCGPFPLSSFVLCSDSSTACREDSKGQTGAGTRLHGWKDEWKNKEARGLGETSENVKMQDVIERVVCYWTMARGIEKSAVVCVRAETKESGGG